MLTRAKGHLQLIDEWRQTAGVSTALEWEWTRLRARMGTVDTWQVRPRQVAHPFEVRLAGSSDFDVFKQIFVDEQYAPLLGASGVRTILDLGANAGFSGVYFLNRFPEARLVAVEPDQLNVAQCRRNLAPYGERAEVLEAAVWSSAAALQIERGKREWATQVRPAEGAGSVAAVTMPELLDRMGGAADIVKVDIEGAEREIFAGGAQWLPRVAHLCIELHGAECERVFRAALEPFAYDLTHSGELTICRNIRPR